MKKYDYLIVGSGISGATFANLMTAAKKKCLIVERRDHIGGNCYDSEKDGILVHRYGAHIFHTSNETIWNYMQKFARFNSFVNSPVANYGGKLYNLPFNMNTFYRLWGTVTPEEALEQIEKQRLRLDREPANLEEQALLLVGSDIYEKLIRGYTEKQWGRNCIDLPAFIIKRIPLRFTYSNNYFDDCYQGIPCNGYSAMIKRMFDGCDLITGEDFLARQENYRLLCHRVVYTGMLDEYFGFSEGHLQYRSLRFEDSLYHSVNYQGVAVMNFTDRETPYTRSIEHKHFLFGRQPQTVVTREYPVEWQPGMEPYYPINDEANSIIAQRYREMAHRERNTIFCGRLAEYRYYNMDQAVKRAMKFAAQELVTS